jgi:hyperpolarization activated cyclic nucleotide-gated potassium channel 1
MLVIKACMYLNGIQKNVKLYGTSSDIYDLTTRNYRFVKEQLYPDLTSTKLKKSKSFYVATTFFSRSIGHNLPFPLIHPDSTLKSVWTLVFLVAIIYTVSLMPYVVVFYEGKLNFIFIFLFFCLFF